MSSEQTPPSVPVQPIVRPRFSCWCGQGLPKGWAKNMGLTGDDVGDVVYPIVDNETCGPIDGYPRPDQMLCWCPSAEKQSHVVEMLRRANGIDVNEDWQAM